MRKTPLEMSVQAKVKVLRSVTRLQKSIEADYALNDAVEDLKRVLSDEVQLGAIPDYSVLDLLRIAGLADKITGADDKVVDASP